MKVKNSYKWLVFLFIWSNNLVLNAQEYSNDSIPAEIKLYNKAIKLIDSTKYEQATQLLKNAVKIKKDYWEAINKMAYIKMKLLDYKGAIKDLEKAYKIYPLNYETIKLEGICYYLQENYKESKKMIDTAVYINHEEKLEDPEIFYYQALLMFKGKSYKTALLSCESALELKPKYCEVMLLKAQVRFATKDYNYAVKELNDAINCLPITKPDYMAYKLRAKSKFELGDYKGAIKDWNFYLDAIPREEEALVSRGASKINVNDHSGAITDLDEAIKLNSKNAVSYCYRGVAKGGNKNYVEALKDLDYSIKLKFDYSTAYVNRAAIKMASKDKRGACEDLEKADGLGNELAMKLYDKYCKQK